MRTPYAASGGRVVSDLYERAAAEANAGAARLGVEGRLTAEALRKLHRREGLRCPLCRASTVESWALWYRRPPSLSEVLDATSVNIVCEACGRGGGTPLHRPEPRLRRHPDDLFK